VSSSDRKGGKPSSALLCFLLAPQPATQSPVTAARRRRRGGPDPKGLAGKGPASFSFRSLHARATFIRRRRARRAGGSNFARSGRTLLKICNELRPAIAVPAARYYNDDDLRSSAIKAAGLPSPPPPWPSPPPLRAKGEGGIREIPGCDKETRPGWRMAGYRLAVSALAWALRARPNTLISASGQSDRRPPGRVCHGEGEGGGRSA